MAEGVAEHNTRQNRRSEVAWGRSFAEVFDESYAAAPIRKATEAQRRLWLLGAEGLKADTNSGQLRFMGNQYWAEWTHEVAGERVIARFDPADLHSGLHVYSRDNAYLGYAECMVKAGFLDIAESREHNRARKAWDKAQKQMLAAHRKFTAIQLGIGLDRTAPGDLPPPDAKVIVGTFGKIVAPRASQPAALSADVAQAQAAIVADLAERRNQKSEAPQTDETERARFGRAVDLERHLAAGGAATVEQRRWLNGYQNTPEYQAQHMLWTSFGEDNYLA